MRSLTFLGTGGTRYVMITQRRHTGGLWFSGPGGDWIIDPGPGALVRAIEAGLDHKNCRGIICTHRHIDHCSDLDVTIEAVTAGGRVQPRYPLIVIVPPESEGPMPRDYNKKRIQKLVHLPQGINLPEGRIQTIPLDHGTDCWGLRFDGFGGNSWGLVSDTRWFYGLGRFYQGCTTLVVNVTLLNPAPKVAHLSTADLPKLQQESGAKKIYMTHMGDWLLDYPAWRKADELTNGNCTYIAAADGLSVAL